MNKTNRNLTILLVILIVIFLALLGVALSLPPVNGAGNTPAETQPSGTEQVVAKDPWEEYLSMSLEEQDAFFQTFASVEEFEAWLESVKPIESTVPVISWDKPGKEPDEYTWEEYGALTREEQEAFANWFASEDAFKNWLETARPVETTVPTDHWDKPGKVPNEYSWDEYQSLSPVDQDAFFRWFESVDAFEAWMKSVKPEETTPPAPGWDKPGKLPSEYTWEEYEALSIEDQDAFFLWFGSVDAFENWMKSTKPTQPTEPAPVWNKPGKLPSEYTWEEYQKLSPEDQDAFFLWFGSVDAFEKWMNAVNPVDTTNPVPGWNKPGKQPDEYTWEEYEALSPEEKDAFFLWFASVEAFEAWMDAAKQP
jgi:hypothetical protein